MEPEVHIIEKYFHQVLHCFTMTNIRCGHSKEIDLLAIDPIKNIKYHVEACVSTTFPLGYNSTKTKKGKSHRNGIDYLATEKFNHSSVVETVTELFGTDQYVKMLVVYSLQEGLDENQFKLDIALKQHILVICIGEMIRALVERAYYMGSRDDVLRLLELIYGREIKEGLRNLRVARALVENRGG